MIVIKSIQAGDCLSPSEPIPVGHRVRFRADNYECIPDGEMFPDEAGSTPNEGE